MSESHKGENGSFYVHHHTDETKALFRDIALHRTKLARPGIEV